MGRQRIGERFPLITLEPQVQQVLPDHHGRWLELRVAPIPSAPGGGLTGSAFKPQQIAGWVNPLQLDQQLIPKP